MSASLPTEKVRESRARRSLTKLGYRLHKTPARSWLRYYGAGYMITENNHVVAGCYQRGYEMTLEQVEVFVTAAHKPGGRKAA